MLALPPETIGNGRVYVKVLFDFERGFPSLRDLAVRSLQTDDEPSALSYVSDDGLARESAQATGTRAGVAE